MHALVDEAPCSVLWEKKQQKKRLEVRRRVLVEIRGCDASNEQNFWISVKRVAGGRKIPAITSYFVPR